MKKTLNFWQLLGFLVSAATGVVLHFAYDLSGENALVALFAPVNESIWEHMKLLFFPMTLFAMVENRRIGKSYAGFWCIKLLGILSATGLVSILFYLICGAIGFVYEWVNIAIFFVCVGFGFAIEKRLFDNNVFCSCNKKKAVAVFFAVALLFAVLTVFPPSIPLFWG